MLNGNQIPEDTLLHLRHTIKHLELCMQYATEFDAGNVEQNMIDAIDNLRWGLRALRKANP